MQEYLKTTVKKHTHTVKKHTQWRNTHTQWRNTHTVKKHTHSKETHREETLCLCVCCCCWGHSFFYITAHYTVVLVMNPLESSPSSSSSSSSSPEETLHLPHAYDDITFILTFWATWLEEASTLPALMSIPPLWVLSLYCMCPLYQTVLIVKVMVYKLNQKC